MSAELHAQQDALAAWIRDPDHALAPPGIEPRRLAVYRRLFFNTLDGLLGSGFPVLRRTLGESDWQALVRGFQRDHHSATPLFTEVGRELLRHLAAHPDPSRPWLQELAHYEWVELALQLSDADKACAVHPQPAASAASATPATSATSATSAAAAPAAPEASAASVASATTPELPDLLDRVPLLSPLAWPLAYAWPVHTIGPGTIPVAQPDAPTLLLLQREVSGHVRFHLLTPLTYRLLQRLDEAPTLTGRAQLIALAEEAGRDPDALLGDGLAMLQRWHQAGIVSGTRDADPR